MKAPWFQLITVVLPILLLGCGAETLVTTGIVAENAKNQAQALKGVTRQAGQQIGLSQIRQAITGFQVEYGRYPYTLDELTTYGYLYSLPGLPEGKQFVYNNVTGEVKVGPVQNLTTGMGPQRGVAPQQRIPQSSQRMPGYGGSPYMQQFQIQQEFQYGNQAHYGTAATAKTRTRGQLRRINRNYQQRQNRYLNEYGP